jgi:hypothetical protein
MRLRALRPILHDGRRYEPGQELDVSEAAAEALIAVGSAEPVYEREEEATASRKRRDRTA